MNDIRCPWCPQCKDSFPMREAAYDGYERSGKTFYCPQGHALVIPQNDIVTQLRSSERFLRHSRDQVQRLHKRVESFKGVISRQRNRLFNGCCPFCGKGSKNMMRHIRERHSK